MPSISHTSQLRRVEPHHERSKRVWRPTALSRDHDCCTRYQVLCIHVSSIHVCIHILGSGESVLGSNLVPVHHTKVRNATHENQTNATRCVFLPDRIPVLGPVASAFKLQYYGTIAKRPATIVLLILITVRTSSSTTLCSMFSRRTAARPSCLLPVVGTCCPERSLLVYA